MRERAASRFWHSRAVGGEPAGAAPPAAWFIADAALSKHGRAAGQAVENQVRGLHWVLPFSARFNLAHVPGAMRLALVQLVASAVAHLGRLVASKQLGSYHRHFLRINQGAAADLVAKRRAWSRPGAEARGGRCPRLPAHTACVACNSLILCEQQSSASSRGERGSLLAFRNLGMPPRWSAR